MFFESNILSELEKERRRNGELQARLNETKLKNIEIECLLNDSQKKTKAQKTEIEMYKRQIDELREQMLNEERKSKKLEYEYKNKEDRFHSDMKQLSENFDKIGMRVRSLLNYLK